MNYHAHIYWENEAQKTVAMELRLTLHDFGCSLGRIRHESVGPHRFPMYQASYGEGIQSKVESFLEAYSSGISILLLENIGQDHLRDHTEGARWIGKKLPLDLDFLRNLNSS